MQTTLLLNEILKKGALLVNQVEVLSIYICGKRKGTAINPPFFKTSLILRTCVP
jgi:hypothetical protein